MPAPAPLPRHDLPGEDASIVFAGRDAVVSIADGVLRVFQPRSGRTIFVRIDGAQMFVCAELDCALATATCAGVPAVTPVKVVK